MQQTLPFTYLSLQEVPGALGLDGNGVLVPYLSLIIQIPLDLSSATQGLNPHRQDGSFNEESEPLRWNKTRKGMKMTRRQWPFTLRIG